MGEEGIGQEHRVGLGFPGAIHGGIGVEPVPKLHCRAEKPIGPAPGNERIDPAQHAVELALENCRIAVGLVNRPGHDGGGICPPGPPKTGLALDDHIGNDGGRPQVVVLVEAQVRQPTQPERLGIEEGASGGREGLGVSCPTESLIPLRAIGRQGDEIVPLRPHHVLMEAIEAGVGALEARPWRQVAADRDELGGNELRLALDLCIPEAVEGEGRLELDLLFTCQGVGVGRLRRPQRMGVKRPVQAPGSRRGAP